MEEREAVSFWGEKGRQGLCPGHGAAETAESRPRLQQASHESGKGTPSPRVTHLPGSHEAPLIGEGRGALGGAQSAQAGREGSREDRGWC